MDLNKAKQMLAQRKAMTAKPAGEDPLPVNVVASPKQEKPERYQPGAKTEISIPLNPSPPPTSSHHKWTGAEAIIASLWCWHNGCVNCSVDAPGNVAQRWFCGRRVGGAKGEPGGVVWKLIKNGVLVRQCPRLKAGELSLDGVGSSVEVGGL